MTPWTWDMVTANCPGNPEVAACIVVVLLIQLAGWRTDCAENETNTTDCAGWFELSNTITFIGEISTRKATWI